MRASPWMLRGGLAALVALTAACNAILGVNDVTQELDAGVDARPCNVAPDFTLVAATPTTSALSHHTTGGGTGLAFLLNADTKPDTLAMDLYDSMGGHGVVNAVGSYTLTSGDAALATCGICVGVYADFDSGTKTFSQTYFAAAQGTLKLDMFDATGIAGSLKGLKLRQVDLSGGTMRDIAGGCTVTIEDAEFTAKWPVTPAPAIAALRTIPPPR
ncbi:MAG TPA: hypothetical protein VF469_13920 [Kofleriaceae bacterium]